jgi:DNA-directed RNA polymerase subunit K/omega
MFRLNLLSKVIDQVPNRYLLVHLIAKRIHQIEEGATPLAGEKYNSIFNKVLEEIIEGKIRIVEWEETPSEKQESDGEP